MTFKRACMQYRSNSLNKRAANLQFSADTQNPLNNGLDLFIVIVDMLTELFTN